MNRGISLGVLACGHHVHLGKEAPRPSAALVGAVPIETGCQVKAVCDLEAQAVNVGDEQAHTHQVLPILVDVKLVSLLDRIDRIDAAIGEGNNLRA